MAVETYELERIEQVRNYKVTKSNDLLQRSRYSLTLQEQRIINFIVAHIKPDDTDISQYFEFKIPDFCRICGIETTNNTYLRKIVKKLFDRPSIEYFDGEKYVPYRWIGDYEIIPKSSTIRIQIHHRMKGFLMELKRNFTSTELSLCLLFTNSYSFHLYELFRSIIGAAYYRNTSIIEYRVPLEEFKHKLVLENKYKNFNDLKRFVIDPSLKEINVLSDLDIALRWEYRGKKVETLVFTISFINPEEWVLRKRQALILLEEKSQ